MAVRREGTTAALTDKAVGMIARRGSVFAFISALLLFAGRADDGAG
jgi:hypothetical protein